MVLACKAAGDPQYGHYALANMTGANRLLVGFGWAVIVAIYWLRRGKREVKLAPAHRTEILFLGLATCYSIIIPLKGTLSLMDTFFFLIIFAVYALRVARADVHEPELIGPARLLGDLPPLLRRASAVALFLFSGTVIYLSAEPFAESLVATGKGWGIDEFLLVQWLAPLASESPEFLIAAIWTFRGDAEAGLAALLSSKVNQWTLLVGTIALVYSFCLGQPGALPLDERQTHELWLTAAQSLFAVAILVDLSLSWGQGLLLLVLFLAQLLYEDIRMEVSAVYLVLAVWTAIRYRSHFPALFRAGGWRPGAPGRTE
jgi:cation:H+ antiporter